MDKFLSYFDIRLRSEITMTLVIVMTMVFNGLIVVGFWNKPAFEILVTLRAIHFVIGMLCLIAIFKFHHHWNLKMAKIFFSIIMTPLFVISWFNHMAMTQSPDSWTPFKGFYIAVLGFTVIAPAGYLFNFYFLLGTVLEIILIWYGLDIPHRSNIILSGEPYYIIGTSLICLLLLLSRYQDEKKMTQLAAEKAKGEFAKILARVLLTIRDRMNTPLQNISLVTHLFKSSPQINPQKISALENAIREIIQTNRQFTRLEALIDWEGKNLMSDEEIEAWLISLDQKKEAHE